MVRPIKIGILSCNHGHAAGYYPLSKNLYYDLVGVSVASGYRHNVRLENWPDISQYDSDDDLYAAHPDMEAVVIASDNASHFRQVKWAVERGLHIFSMKVPSFDPNEYLEMMRITSEAGLVFKVELELRNHAEVLRVKSLIEQGAIGDILSITALNYSHNPVWWRPWQATPEASYGKRVPLYHGADRFRGGALADHPHIFDCIRYVLSDDFDELYAEVGPNLRDTEIEEMISVIGRTKRGVAVSIDPSYAAIESKVVRMRNWRKAPKTVEVTMTVHGTEGSIIADLFGLWTFENGGPDNYYIGEQSHRPFDLGNLSMQFYHAVRNGEEPTVGMAYHYNTIAAMNAAYESVSCGIPVKVENEYF
ncbi:MAG: Gfo/Idh/MocA family oxidoreductase [Clostridia bacterium]